MPSRRQRIVSYGIPSTAIATVITAALLSPWVPGPNDLPPGPDPGPDPTPVQIPVAHGGHAIDVVFAVDTTGSMGELIEGAKRTVWSIATHIRKTDPNANLQIGLVAYRDSGDAYVTRPFSLTTDLDAVYAELAGYTADGGDDPPENVAAALRDALAMRWRAGAKKLVFVVGDAPPIDRGDAPPYDVLAREAASAGIVVNAIRCGDNAATAAAFQQLARLGGGEFSTIAQDGGVRQVATPYDAQLAAVSARIDRTAVIVGDEGARAGYEAKMNAAAAAPAPAKADRASYYARKSLATGGRDLRDDGDLVGSYAEGRAALDEVAPGALPTELRNKTRPELEAELSRRAEERAAAQRELSELVKRRDEYLSAKGGGDGFDATVKATVEKQLK